MLDFIMENPLTALAVVCIIFIVGKILKFSAKVFGYIIIGIISLLVLSNMGII